MFAKIILDWYASNKRDLPWRKTDDPYHILVSEMMLQQTQVDRVIPKYLAFLDAFPTPWHLASARPAEVISLWSGLGYNRRAVYLQRIAKQVVELNGFPDDDEGLLKLPGIGKYTARAIQSFAFHKDVAVIDTNIRRIFSRVFFEGSGTEKDIDAKVGSVVPKGEGTAYNNALMDFGSLICTASNPKCEQCPMSTKCSAFKRGKQDAYLRIAAPQKRFEGSRRQYRGMVLRELKSKARTVRELTQALKKDQSFVVGILDELERDDLIKKENSVVRLP